MKSAKSGFIFLSSWWSAISNLTDDERKDVLIAIVDYGLHGECTSEPSPIAKTILEIIKPQIQSGVNIGCNDSFQKMPSPGNDRKDLQAQIDEYKHNKPLWKESIQMKYKISASEIDVLLDEFYIDMCCKEIDIMKVSALFTGWLTQRQYENRKNITTKRHTARSKAATEPGHGLREN